MSHSQLELQDYARETYTNYKEQDFFHAMICTLIHAYDFKNTVSLTKTVNKCTQTEHKKVNEKTIESFLDSFAEEGLIMLGIEKDTITHKPTALGNMVLALYDKDPDNKQHHKLPKF